MPPSRLFFHFFFLLLIWLLTDVEVLCQTPTLSPTPVITPVPTPLWTWSPTSVWTWSPTSFQTPSPTPYIGPVEDCYSFMNKTQNLNRLQNQTATTSPTPAPTKLHVNPTPGPTVSAVQQYEEAFNTCQIPGYECIDLAAAANNRKNSKSQPELCPHGYFCPNYCAIELCPKNSYCPLGSFRPTNCTLFPS